MKKRVFLSSIMMIVLCTVMITGATFALFTSESKVNIAVTSGTVEAVATIADKCEAHGSESRSKVQISSLCILIKEQFARRCFFLTSPSPSLTTQQMIT